MPGADFVLRTFSLTKTFAGRLAIDHVSLQIQKGQVYGLLGKSGAGKTTLIRMITGLIHADEGEIELFGERAKSPPRGALSRVGYMAEMPAMCPSLTAAQNLEYYRLQQGIPERERVLEVLELVGLSAERNSRYGHLTSGMKQRLGLALAVLNHPDFIIMDEPANGLDPLDVIAIREILKHLNENLGVTLLVTSHNLAELYRLATDYGILHDGRLIREFTKEQLDEQCRRYLRLTVDNISAAAIVLETILNTTDYQVIDQHEIHLYDHLDVPGDVTYQLSLANVRVSSIYEMGASLEDYFRAAIEEAG